MANVCFAADAPAPRLTVHDTAIHDISPLLFGQFLERPCGGETGPEAFADPISGRLPPHIVAMLRQMQIPVIRFPAGTDIDFTDWRDMVSNVPGRQLTTELAQRPITYGKAKTPVTNRFGYDEYFALQKELGCQTIFTVNLRDAFVKKVPLAEAAQLAAGLVAYANAPVGAKLPAGMPDWPAVRARNGHAAPHGVRYFQIGNEAWLFVPKALEELKWTDDPAGAAAWLTECYLAFAQQMREVDPGIELIIDGNLSGKLSDMVLADPRIRALRPLITRHCYAPGPMDTIWKGPTSRPAELTTRDWWNAWTAMPGGFDEQGQCLGPAADLARAKSLGYKSACTEWNWAGFGFERLSPKPELNFRFASSLGAAGFIHGMLRSSDELVLATQSMLLGSKWNFAAVHAESADDPSPYYSPQATATNFYNQHHGKSLLRTSIANIPTYPQPFQFGWGPVPAKAVGILDVLATGDQRCVYIHAINRDISQAHTLAVELRGFPGQELRRPIVHYYLTGEPHHRPEPSALGSIMRVETQVLAAPNSTTFAVQLPPHSISVFECPR